MTATTAIVVFRLPHSENRPRPVPRSLRVPAGTYLTERGDAASVPEQVGNVDGWHYDHPNMQVVLRVEVCRG